MMRNRKILTILLAFLTVMVCGVLILEAFVLRDLRRQEEAFESERAAAMLTETEEVREKPEPTGTVPASENPESEAPEPGETTVPEESPETEEDPVVIGTPYPETAPEGWAYSEPEETYPPYRDGIRVWVGDSRMVGLERSAAWEAGKDLFIAKGAMSYQWFAGTAVPELKGILSQYSVSYVLINMGLNDCANNCKGWKDYTVQNYIETINALIDAYPDTEFCFLSVGLTDGVYRGTTAINPAELMVYIDSFNFNMYTYCKARFIPVSRYIEDQGFRTADGVHYGTEVNRAIYDYVLRFLRGESLGGSG